MSNQAMSDHDYAQILRTVRELLDKQQEIVRAIGWRIHRNLRAELRAIRAELKEQS